MKQHNQHIVPHYATLNALNLKVTNLVKQSPEEAKQIRADHKQEYNAVSQALNPAVNK